MDFIHRVSLFYTIMVILAVPFELYLAFLVLSKDRLDRRNQLFFLFALSNVVFLITNYLADAATNSLIATWDLRVYFVSTSIMTAGIFLFLFVFPQNLRVSRWVGALFTLIGLIFAGLSLSPALVSSVKIESWGANIIGGPFFNPYNMLNLAFLLAFLIFLIFRLIRSHGQSRRQLLFLALGFLVFFVVNLVVNVVLPIITGTAQYARFGSYASIFFLVISTYAIISQHLFDIRVIIRRTVVFTALVAVVFGFYSLVIFLLTQVLDLGGSRGQFNIYINGVTLLIVGYTFQPIREWISDQTDRWLFKKEYEQESVLKELGQKLNNVVGLDEALEGVMQTIAKVLHLKHAVTYVFQPGEHNTLAIKRVKQIGYPTAARLILEDRDFTVQYFSQNQKVCIVEDFRLELEQEKDMIEHKKASSDMIRQHAIKQAVLKKLDSLEVAIAIPLQLNNQPLGLVLLSEKLSGERYSAQDLALLDLVGAQAISSIQKAKLYEGDQMKSEFVSIASHELLTPISAIEGYLSMILEENIGKVDPQARDYLNKVYTSAKRLSLLIKDLLSVSRIESGKMKIEPQQLDIAKMVTDTLDQLKFVAADKKLEMTFEKPAKPLPPVWADPDRTMQVMVNLVSNAIKYTPQGKVTITTDVDRRAGLVSVSVADTGLGMSKDQMAHLFTKFYRVDTPQTSGIMGTGLGLYITKSIIEKMGGEITCKSLVGHGTTFTFSLPIFKVETSTAS